MAQFRFRAAAALDVRRKQEQAAEVVLAAAEARFLAADRAWTASIDDIGKAAQELETQSRAGIRPDQLDWHRNWIVRLTAKSHERREQRAREEQGVTSARQAWQAARRRRLMLERLRDRAFERYRRAEHLAEMKHLDELARVRFTTAAIEHERSQR
jgi:flagellar export protein FliJ